jgi:hypothetical protein
LSCSHAFTVEPNIEEFPLIGWKTFYSPLISLHVPQTLWKV